ncbi:hypothetical protein WMY93_009501 [Mugilogobius chulae]|uniref:Uncharacterized protein n=1 Tax=Mugilogobius chulae TaxID=88201 RepID=A0AAW0PI56_9GOBI
MEAIHHVEVKDLCASVSPHLRPPMPLFMEEHVPARRRTEVNKWIYGCFYGSGQVHLFAHTIQCGYGGK